MDGSWAAGIYKAQSSQGRADRVDRGRATQQREQKLEESLEDGPESKAGTKQIEPAKQLCEQLVRKLRGVLAGAKHIRLKRGFVDEPVSSEALQRVQKQSTKEVSAEDTSRYLPTTCQTLCNSFCAW